MRVLVCGGRDYDRMRVWDQLFMLDAERGPFDVVIHGCSGNTDWEAEHVARELGRKVCGFRAEWDRLGKKAGPARNERMLRDGKPDLVIAFPGGRGTADMVRRALSAGVEVLTVA